MRMRSGGAQGRKLPKSQISRIHSQYLKPVQPVPSVPVQFVLLFCCAAVLLLSPLCRGGTVSRTALNGSAQRSGSLVCGCAITGICSFNADSLRLLRSLPRPQPPNCSTRCHQTNQVPLVSHCPPPGTPSHRPSPIAGFRLARFFFCSHLAHTLPT